MAFTYFFRRLLPVLIVVISFAFLKGIPNEGTMDPIRIAKCFGHPMKVSEEEMQIFHELMRDKDEESGGDAAKTTIPTFYKRVGS